jgi:cell division transport system permease protein
VISEGYWSLAENLSQAIAACLTVLIAMLLLGMFIGLGSWTLSWSNHVKRELAVHVYFKASATPLQETDYARGLQQNVFVKTDGLRFVSRRDALELMRKRTPDLVEGLAINPLGDSFAITPRTPEDTDRLYRSLTSKPLPAFVDRVRDGRQISHRILQVAHVIEGLFFAAAAILVAASVLLIGNTIRLSVFSRRREIEVMKLVGASNWFVRGPFMVEGLLCGAVGSFAAVGVLLAGRILLLPAVLPSLSNDPDVHAVNFGATSAALLGIGLFVGAAGSAMTLRRFMRV